MVYIGLYNTPRIPPVLINFITSPYLLRNIIATTRPDRARTIRPGRIKKRRTSLMGWSCMAREISRRLLNSSGLVQKRKLKAMLTPTKSDTI